MVQKKYKEVNILIASPSDLTEERNIAEQIIHRLEIPCENNLHLVLKPRRWELDAASEMGRPAQDVIDEQIVKNCDGAVCMFWTRIGTPTQGSPGGTVKEYEFMVNEGKLVMLYFSDVPVAPSKMDNEQWDKLTKWKKKLIEEDRGLMKSYSSIHEFEKMLERELRKQLLVKFCGEKEVQDDSESDQAMSLLEDEYQSTLKEEMGWIKLLGSPDIERVQVGLTDTFVPLRISDRWKSEGRFNLNQKVRNELEEDSASPDEILQWVFSRYRMFLVIGDPGSGKSTLLKYYAICCLEHKQDRLFKDARPVRVFFLPLRELRQNDAGFLSLPENLSLWAAERSLTIEPKRFDGWLRDRKRKSLVLLDGLDEISDREKRKAACIWIDKTWSGFSSAYFVITGRSSIVHGPDKVSLSATYSRADVMDFSKEQQKKFLLKWFNTLYGAERPSTKMSLEIWQSQQKSMAEKKAEAIYDYLYSTEQFSVDQSHSLSEKRERKGLQELAAVPMMLQIMAILFKEKEYLPGNRAKLYSATLNYLLEIRDANRNIFPPLPSDKARRVLAPVALWMQEELKKDEVERSKVYDKMKPKLEEVCSPKRPPTSDKFCQYLVTRAGVLVDYGDQDFIFRHKTFREYLVGEQLSQEMHKEKRIKDLVSHFGDDWWNEPLIFFMSQIDAESFDLFMKELFASSVVEKLPEKMSLLRTLIEESAERKTDALCQKLLESRTAHSIQLSVLDCIKTIGMSSALDSLRKFRVSLSNGDVNNAKNRMVLDRTDEIIFNLEKSAGIKPVSERTAVDIIAKDIITATPDLGTPGIVQKSLQSFRNSYEHDAQYILIPGGKYIYSQPEPDGQEVTVPKLYVAKYSVTNKQYRSFIDFLAGKVTEYNSTLSLQSFQDALHGLARSKDDAVKGFDGYLKEESNLVERFRSEYDDDRKFNKDDQPVVGVSWYAARAYCLWLSMLVGEGPEYRLPDEKEWEWVAGGQRDKPDQVLKVREYPWGDEPEPTPKHANYDENEGSTTSVGSYPEGATPEGLYDMAGNAWEWMDNWYDDDKDWKAVRGGSWDLNSEYLACSFRYFNVPVNWLDFVIGFRVVRPSPFS